MAFVRLVQVVTDYALGLQSVNKAQANLDAMLATLAAEHSPLDNRNAPPPGQSFGHHNTPHVARASVLITASLQPGGGRVFSTTSGLTSDVVGAASWVGTGICFLPIYGLSTFSAHPVPKVTTATSRFVKSSPWYPAGGQAGLFFACWDLGASTFGLVGFDFCATIYGVV